MLVERTACSNVASQSSSSLAAPFLSHPIKVRQSLRTRVVVQMLVAWRRVAPHSYGALSLVMVCVTGTPRPCWGERCASLTGGLRPPWMQQRLAGDRQVKLGTLRGSGHAVTLPCSFGAHQLREKLLTSSVVLGNAVPWCWACFVRQKAERWEMSLAELSFRAVGVFAWPIHTVCPD